MRWWQDEVGSLEPTASIVSAVKGNDSFHPTMSIFCGIQCGPQSWDAHVYRQIAAVHDVFGIDSCATAALPLPLLQPDCLAPDCLVPDSRRRHGVQARRARSLERNRRRQPEVRSA